MDDIKKVIAEKVASLMGENLTLITETNEAKKKYEKKIDNIFCDFLSVIDTFERAERTIKERGLAEDENAKKAVNRLLNAKKKALVVLDKFNVKKIVFENNRMVEDLCEVTATEPNSSKEDGEILTIEKDGYTRDGHLIRSAEVVIVKN